MTRIEWARNDDGSQGKTWNPSVGCNRISPGCDHCYAMLFEHRFSGEGQRSHKLTMYREGDGAHAGVDWTGRVNFFPDRLDLPLRRKTPTTWFVNSQSDLFHNALTNEQIAAVYGVMAAARQHRFIVLTKRYERMAAWYRWLRTEATDPIGPREPFICGVHAANYGADVDYLGLPDLWPLRNVVVGVSAENQEYWNARMRFVHDVPAAMRVASLEPLLGPINLRGTGRIHLDGVFVGGESGPGARPMHVDWARSLRDQCAETGIAFFMKQLGARPEGLATPVRNVKGADMSEWPEDLRVRELPWLRTS